MRERVKSGESSVYVVSMTITITKKLKHLSNSIAIP